MTLCLVLCVTLAWLSVTFTRGMDMLIEQNQHVEALAHLPAEIWNKVKHLPTTQAIALGGQLLFVKRQADMNKAIAKSIWGNL